MRQNGRFCGMCVTSSNHKMRYLEIFYNWSEFVIMILVALYTFWFHLAQWIATYYFSLLSKLNINRTLAIVWFHMMPATTAVHMKRCDYSKPLNRPHSSALDIKHIVSSGRAPKSLLHELLRSCAVIISSFTVVRPSAALSRWIIFVQVYSTTIITRYFSDRISLPIYY